MVDDGVGAARPDRKRPSGRRPTPLPKPGTLIPPPGRIEYIPPGGGLLSDPPRLIGLVLVVSCVGGFAGRIGIASAETIMVAILRLLS